MKYALFIFVLSLPGLHGIFAAELYTFSARYEYDENSKIYSGAHVSLPFAESRIFMQFSPRVSDFSIKNWSAVLRPVEFWRLSVGNLYVSGIFSRLNSPVFSTPSALKTFGTQQTGLFVSQPAFSSSEIKTAALVTSVRFGQFQLHAGGRLEKAAAAEQLRKFSFPFFTAFEYTFPGGGKKRRPASALRGTAVVLAGHVVLKSKDENSWFRSLPYFAPTSVHYILGELTLKNNKIEFFTSNGFMEHPLGSPHFFTRTEFSARFGFFCLHTAFSLVDNLYMGATGSVITQGAHCYVNPQLEIPLGAEGTAKLRGGFLAALKFRQSADRKAEKKLEADFKAGVAFSSRFFLAESEYRIGGCNFFNKFAPSKDCVQIIHCSAAYRMSPVKPKLRFEVSLKHESSPFYYGTDLSLPKTRWLVLLKSEFRVLPDFKIKVASETLFKKSANEYGVLCSFSWHLFTGAAASEISADFSYKYKVQSKQHKFSAGIKYILQIRQTRLNPRRRM